MTLIVCKKKSIELIKKKLKNDNIHCELQPLFTKYHFSSAKYTAILLCDVQHEELLKRVSFSKKYEIEGKMLFVLNITDYLKL